MDDQPDELEALLAGMRAQFLATSADRVAAIVAAAEGLALSPEPSRLLALLVREAHTLKGGGATFGFPSLGEAGGRVEHLGKALLAEGHDGPLEPLHQAVADLRTALAGIRRPA